MAKGKSGGKSVSAQIGPAAAAPQKPAVAAASSPAQNTSVELTIDGKKRVFDVEDPKLPKWIDDAKLSSGGYPYAKKLDSAEALAKLEALQVELVKLQEWQASSKARIVVVFEGRDAAGKGGTINAVRAYLNPRTARNVALAKPSDSERGQWYFQRYIAHLPTFSEFVTYDRSWYNRAGVEPVMGFCTPEQHEEFLQEAPNFEKMLVSDGIHLFKFWLDIGRETQLKRFHDRRHSPLRHWKFNTMDIAGIGKWDAYGKARDIMFERTDSKAGPWTVVKSNDKGRARIEVLRHILLSVKYDGRDLKAIGEPDRKIIDGVGKGRH
jgi:polyphosphate kinase